MKRSEGFVLATYAEYDGKRVKRHSVMYFDDRDAAERRMRRNFERAYEKVGADNMVSSTLWKNNGHLDGINAKGNPVHHDWKIVELKLWKGKYRGQEEQQQ